MTAVIVIGAILVLVTAIAAATGNAFWTLPAALAVSTVLLAVSIHHGVPGWVATLLVVAILGLIVWTFAAAASGWLIVLALGVATLGLATWFWLFSSPSHQTEAKPNQSASSTPSPTPSASATAATLNAKAANWVKSMTLNFEGVTDLPAKCAAYQPTVDLTEIHWYARDTSKESPEAFGTSMGDNPCDISINRVERAYRDPFYVLQKANEIKAVDPSFDFTAYTPDQQATRVTELQNAPFAEREALADKVLGWYSDPSRVLKIEQKNEAYASAGASTGSGVVTSAASQADKASTVVTTADRKTGATLKQDRENCGDQPYKPTPPPPPSTTTQTPTCTSTQTGTWPNCLEKKHPTLDPARRGNAPAGGGTNIDPGPGTYVAPSEMVHPPSSPYVAPAAPAVTTPPVGSTPDPAPAPPPQVSAPPASAPATGCAPAPGMTTC